MASQGHWLHRVGRFTGLEGREGRGWEREREGRVTPPESWETTPPRPPAPAGVTGVESCEAWPAGRGTSQGAGTVSVMRAGGEVGIVVGRVAPDPTLLSVSDEMIKVQFHKMHVVTGARTGIPIYVGGLEDCRRWCAENEYEPMPTADQIGFKVEPWSQPTSDHKIFLWLSPLFAKVPEEENEV